MFPSYNNCKIGIIGLGYVGLPLASEFAKKKKCLISENYLEREVLGFDTNSTRINQLNKSIDITDQISETILSNLDNLKFTNNSEELIRCEVFIVTVPTPITQDKQPDLSPLSNASKILGNILKKRKLQLPRNNLQKIPVLIFESTVYPGATEEICIPIIEKFSGLKLNHLNPLEGFVVGYSPERINPGDKLHTLTSIVKVTSGSNNEARKWVNNFYSSIIKAGTYSTSSIKEAEAAKVIENTQRDLNIALINELSMIFQKMNINTKEVLKAAGTKWNFLNFKPGLVGGHCIGVDPYYLTHKSIQLGYTPKVVLAGREINDSMADWIVNLLIKKMSFKKIPIGDSKILILGYTFKENCRDTRNTQVIKIINNLKDYNTNIFLFDPYINQKNFKDKEINILDYLSTEVKFDAVIICVAHKEFHNKNAHEWIDICNKNHVFLDIKNILPDEIDAIRI